MDSINQQQLEKNKENLQGSEAAKKIKELFEDATHCFFCTKIQTGQPFITRPMSAQKIDDDATCWFLSAKDSHKNAEIAQDPNVQILFQGSKHSEFVTLYGAVTVSQDKEKIKELWEPTLKTWFTEGVDDPRITVIKFTPVDGYYWDTKHGEIVGFAKQLVGSVIGQTLDDSIEGKLKP